MSSNQGVPKVEPPCMVLFSVAPEPRLAIHILLFGEWEQICAFYAIVCSSWVPVNRGSTGRSIMTPLGCEDYPNVRASNKMTSRMVSVVGVSVGSVQVGGQVHIQSLMTSILVYWSLLIQIHNIFMSFPFGWYGSWSYMYSWSLNLIYIYIQNGLLCGLLGFISGLHLLSKHVNYKTTSYKMYFVNHFWMLQWMGQTFHYWKGQLFFSSICGYPNTVDFMIPFCHMTRWPCIFESCRSSCHRFAAWFRRDIPYPAKKTDIIFLVP